MIDPAHGFLIPEHFVPEDIGTVPMNVASIFWGFSLAIAVFCAGKAFQHTRRAWRRNKGITIYAGMLWGEWIANITMGIISWTYQWGVYPSSFGVFFAVALVWTFQVHFLLQIIINRISLLMVVPQQATRLKIGVFVVIMMINISVFCIWIPARLQISPMWVKINSIWDPIEKIIFCIVDALLNIYFVYLVRTRLINNGLTKYQPLFKVNLFLVALSLSLDVCLVGLMFSPNTLMYLQFQSLVYFGKTYIEMCMAELIIKVVRASNPDHYEYQSSTTGRDGKDSAATGVQSRRFTTALSKGHNNAMRGHSSAAVQGGTRIEAEEYELAEGQSGPAGIQKTIETTVVFEEQDGGDAESRSSSTRELRRHYGVSDSSGNAPGVEPKHTLDDNK